jgi:hypothetical protein
MNANSILLMAASSAVLSTSAIAQTTSPTQDPNQPPPAQDRPMSPTQSQVPTPAESRPSQPTQSQEMPPAASQETVTPIAPATAADVKAGAKVLAKDGSSVGTVESVATEGVVISTGKARVQVPLASLRKGERGLIIAMTKAELEAAASKEPRRR